jgi:glycogen debranching enzyme
VPATNTNRSRERIAFDIRCEVSADFADLLEAESGKRQQTAPIETTADAAMMSLRYCHPRLPYRAEIRAVAGWRVEPGALSARIELDPQESRQLRFDVLPFTSDTTEEADGAAAGAAAREWTDSFTRILVPGNPLAERIIGSNVRDIASFAALDGTRDEWLSPQAGVPAYPAFFGRDAVTAGWQAALLDRGRSLDASLTKLGRRQADHDDEWRDAEPGRLPYQMRSGPLARLGVNPYSAYYADYASPLMFVISLANLFAWSGDMAAIRRHWDTARRVMDWARDRGDADGDGYLEYHTRSKDGTKNQGWKDSGDAIVDEDGRPVPSPIATCELQGYWFVAQNLMAAMCVAMNHARDAASYAGAASDLKARFNRDWWIEADRSFALALDPDKRPVRAMTSNVGHCLATGIIDARHLPATVGRLFAPDMFSGWGIRTLSADHSFYDPVSYHRGSVWAVEQGTIVFGLRRFGFDARAVELATAMFDLAELYPEFRIPECVGGHARAERPVPGAYPRANTPQLWNASAMVLTLQSLLGIVPLAPMGALCLDPVLPEWMPHVILRRLRVGDAAVTLSCRRRPDGTTDWDVSHLRGRLHVFRQPPPESLTASAGDRLSALLESLHP